MTCGIYGEITADGKGIVLIATGDDYEIDRAAKALRRMTPLLKKTDPPSGTLTAPATWATVTQLAYTFNGESLGQWMPQARLREWITAEFLRRHADVLAGTAELAPPGLTPRPYQVEGASMIAMTGGSLLFDDPGCLYGDAEITVNRAGKGFTVKLRDLVARVNGNDSRYPWRADIPTFVQREVDGVVRLTRLSAAWASGIKQTYAVTTSTGRTVRASCEHPFLTERGWVRLDELVPGDLVHVRGAQASGRPRQPKARYREIAGLYGHPHAVKRNHAHSSWRVAEHRLVAESALNNMTLAEFTSLARTTDISGLALIDPATHAVHHKDLNPLNNEPGNLEVLTHAEHHALHAALGKVNSVLYKVTTEKVTSVEPHGNEETYDIEVEGEPHNFLAAGFVVHNTGKTVTTILGLRGRESRGEKIFPMVIIVPSWEVGDVWVRHVREWAPSWGEALVYGGPGRTLASPHGHAVYVTTYATATLDAASASGPLVKLKARAVVLDESHYAKNEKAQRTGAVQRIASRAGTFVALTGTPVTRDTGDIFPVLQAMDPETYPSRPRFVKRYLDTSDNGYGEVVEGLAALAEPEFRAALAGQYRRVSKADVLSQLPPKIYSVRRTEIPPAWRKAYDTMQDEMLAELPDGTDLPVMSTLAQLTRLSQLASSACDVAVTEERDEQTGDIRKHYEVTLKAPSWKADALLGVLAERPGEQVAVFANSRQLIGIAGYALQHKYRCGYITGGQGKKERHDAIEKFQAGQLDVILCTAGAGGLGITLTAAGTVVFLQRSWELDKAVQPEDRAHRLDDIVMKHDAIEIIDIVAKDTVDDRVRELMRVKGGHLGQLVRDPRIVREILGGLR